MITVLYYSRHQGGLKELSKLIFEREYLRISTFPNIIGIDYSENDALKLVCQALAFAITNKIEYGYELAQKIQVWIPNLTAENRKVANLQLATRGAQFTNQKPEFYAKEVIDNYIEYCQGHELIHALDNILHC